MKRPTGRFRIWRNGLLICERNNLVVNAGLPAFAEAAAGNTAYKIAVMGWGSGTTAPTVNDTDMAGPQKYYNAIASSSFPSSGTVQFSFQLQTTDYASIGMTVNEVGLYANSAAVGIPVQAGITTTAWAASHAYAVGALILDSNGNVQRCTTAGTSGTTHPTWPTTVGNTVTDGTAVWTCIALAVVPGPMVAHAIVSSFSVTGIANYSGTWSLTF